MAAACAEAAADYLRGREETRALEVMTAARARETRELEAAAVRKREAATAREREAAARPPNASRFDSGDFSFHHSPSTPPPPPPEGDEALARAIHDAEFAVRAAHLDAAPQATGSFSIGVASGSGPRPGRFPRRIIRARRPPRAG